MVFHQVSPNSPTIFPPFSGEHRAEALERGDDILRRLLRCRVVLLLRCENLWRIQGDFLAESNTVGITKPVYHIITLW